MDEHELARRMSALPDTFRSRLDGIELRLIDNYTFGGEWTLSLETLIGSLAQSGRAITKEEYMELKELAGRLHSGKALSMVVVKSSQVHLA